VTRPTQANAKETCRRFSTHSSRISTQASAYMQKHARVSKIAHIFQAQNERWVGGSEGRKGSAGARKGERGKETEYFLFRS